MITSITKGRIIDDTSLSEISNSFKTHSNQYVMHSVQDAGRAEANEIYHGPEEMQTLPELIKTQSIDCKNQGASLTDGSPISYYQYSRTEKNVRKSLMYGALQKLIPLSLQGKILYHSTNPECDNCLIKPSNT